MFNTQQKPKLSKGILDMKFMKKSKERVEKELEDAEGNAMYSNDITEQMRKGEKFAVVEVSISTCKDLIEGRLSFGGMNPNVEQMMSDENLKRLEKIQKEKETDISDLEMAKKYNSTVKTIQKKFQTKKKNYRKKFLKPKELD